MRRLQWQWLNMRPHNNTRENKQTNICESAVAWMDARTSASSSFCYYFPLRVRRWFPLRHPPPPPPPPHSIESGRHARTSILNERGILGCAEGLPDHRPPAPSSPKPRSLIEYIWLKFKHKESIPVEAHRKRRHRFRPLPRRSPCRPDLP